MQLPRLAMPRGYAGKLILGGVVAATASLAIAAIVVVNGYISHPEAFWIERISERTQSPIYGADGTLIGSVDTQGKLAPDSASDLAFIPLRGFSVTLWQRQI